MFDWFKKIFNSQIPQLPAPFGWLTSFIQSYVWDPTRRTLSEAYEGLRLIGGEVGVMQTNRDWYVDRLKAKFLRILGKLEERVQQIYGAGKAYAEQLLVAFKLMIFEGIAVFQASITSIVAAVSNKIDAFIANVWTPIWTFIQTQLAGISVQLRVLANITKNALDFWQTVYETYRAELAAFLSDPVGYLLTLVERELGRHLASLARLGASILDELWMRDE